MVAVLDRIPLLHFSFPIMGCNPPQGGVSPLAKEGRTLIDLAVPLTRIVMSFPKPMPARTKVHALGFKVGGGESQKRGKCTRSLTGMTLAAHAGDNS